jgi:type IV pilus assembly protein PilC
LKIGEESGKLSEVLSEIKKYYERKQKQRRQVSGALTYPILVLFTANLAVGFMLSVIVPMFEEVFQRFQGSLPPLTQRIIDLSDWMKQHGWLFLTGILALVLILRSLAKLNWYKGITHRMVLKIPVIGSLVKSIQTARFCHIMALLTSAHSPLVQSLNMIAKMIAFIPLKQAIISTSNMVTEGNSLNESMEASEFFDKKFTSLIKAAELVNQLDYAFEKLNIQYNEEIDHKLIIMEKLIEPLLIIMVGGLVAIILIAMYLPLFQLGSSIY